MLPWPDNISSRGVPPPAEPRPHNDCLGYSYVAGSDAWRASESGRVESVVRVPIRHHANNGRIAGGAGCGGAGVVYEAISSAPTSAPGQLVRLFLATRGPVAPISVHPSRRHLSGWLSGRSSTSPPPAAPPRSPVSGLTARNFSRHGASGIMRARTGCARPLARCASRCRRRDIHAPESFTRQGGSRRLFAGRDAARRGAGRVQRRGSSIATIYASCRRSTSMRDCRRGARRPVSEGDIPTRSTTFMVRSTPAKGNRHQRRPGTSGLSRFAGNQTRLRDRSMSSITARANVDVTGWLDSRFYRAPMKQMFLNSTLMGRTCLT